jgi:hypothetical protein
MRAALRVFAAIAIVLLIVYAASAIARASYIYPSSETQSKFFRTYTTTQTVKRFKENYNSTASGSAESLAGHKFVTYRADKEDRFVLKREAKPALMQAIDDDISTRLLAVGARITGREDSAAGLQIHYELANTRGLVSISPLKTENPQFVTGPRRICPNEEAVILRIQFAETWSDAPAESRADWPTFRSP